MGQREKTLISNVIPEYLQEASLLQIDCQMIIYPSLVVKEISSPFKQIAVSFLLAAFVREDYTKDIFPMVSGTDRPENSWCGRKKIRGFQTRNSQLVQRLVSRNRNMRTSKVFSFPLQLLVTQLMLWIAYLIIVIFLHWHNFCENKIYTPKRRFFALNQ